MMDGMNYTETVSIMDDGWYELHRDGVYHGWVRLESKTGLIEFGEPG
jgi:hypothetical protein